MQKNRSFTLIELLVVIAIIGLISSLVLVNIGLPTQKQKARIAKTLEFSSSIQNALGAEAVGIWEFDEGSGNTANDRSGYGNNGIINSGVNFTDDTPQKIAGQGQGKYALNFNGSSGYVNAGNGTSLNITSAITIEAWVKPNTLGNWLRIAQKCNVAGIRESYCLILKGGTEQVRWEIFSANTQRVVDSNQNLPIGKWTHIVATYNGQVMRIYFNGALDNSTDYGSNTSMGTNNLALYIGSSVDDPLYFNGLIDEVRIYAQALTIGQIKKNYAEGLQGHQYAKK